MSDDRADSDPGALAEDLDTVGVAVGDRADRVASVAVERPEKRNALNDQVRRELKTALTACEESDAVRVIVLTGSEECSAFVAGADIAEFADRSAIEQREASKRPRIYEHVENLETPVIARINGHCLGGGNELALACDIRYARSDAKLGQPEISLGIMPGGGASQRLPRLVGEGQAMRLALSGEIIDAEEAHEIGMVDGVFDSGAFDEAVYELAGSIAEKSPVALEFTKKAVKAASRMDLDAGIEYEAELFSQLFSTADKDEGIAAFLEDREPEWSGR
jgi:enoyl-CoA hydratase